MKQTLKTSYFQRFALWQAVVFFGLLSFTSCKNNDPIGLDVQPDGQLDLVQEVDTFTILTSTRKSQAINSTNLQDYIGRLESEEFGVTKSDIAVDFLLSMQASLLPEDFDNYKIDSAVLYVRPTGYFGHYGSGANVNIYRLTEALSQSETYYSNYEIQYDSANPVGSFNLSLNNPPSSNLDTTVINGITYNYKIIRALLDEQTTMDLVEWQKDPENSATEFDGLALITDNISDGDLGCLYQLSLLAADSRIILYARSSEAIDSSDYQIVFPISSNSNRVSVYHHDYTGAKIESYVNDSNNLNQDTFFIQGLAGLKGQIKIPHLNKLNELGDIAINRAILKIPTAEIMDDTLIRYPNLFLLDDDPDGETFNLDYLTNTTRHGGSYNLDSSYYQFDITRTVQDIVLQAKNGVNVNYGFTLNVEIPALNGNQWQRLKFKGGDNVKFTVYYTDITD